MNMNRFSSLIGWVQVPLQQIVLQGVFRVLTVDILVLLRVVRHYVECLLLPLVYSILIFHYSIPIVWHTVLGTRWWKMIPFLPLILWMLPNFLFILMFVFWNWRMLNFLFFNMIIFLGFFAMFMDKGVPGFVAVGLDGCKILAIGSEVIDTFVEMVGFATS